MIKKIFKLITTKDSSIYENSLHKLLCENNSIGLSPVEIAKELGISLKQCNKILADQTSKDKLATSSVSQLINGEGDMYRSTRLTSTNDKSFEQELSTAKKKLSTKRLATGIVTIGISLCSGIPILIPQYLSHLRQKAHLEHLTKSDVQDAGDELTQIEKYVQLKALERRKVKGNNQIAQISKQLEIMNKLKLKEKCDWLWSKDKSCYIEGRYLTKSRFEQEINFMENKINTIKDTYSQ